SETIAWIKEITFNKLGLDDKESLIRILRKVLILEPMDFYCKLDNWPQENERLNIYRITSEGIPLAEDTVKNILSLGFHPEVALSRQDAFELIWTLIHHATMNFDGDMNHPVLLLNDPKIIDMLFSCCEYVCPDNAPLPENYLPPKLARVDLYWKVWFMLVIIAAHLPSTFGKSAWNAFPTFQALIEMTITNYFQFPPKSMDNDEMQNKILQYNQFEKLKILEFENFLARDQEINESNSYLISSLITLDPCSIPRRPPNPILNDYKLLCTNNTNYRLCHLLCQSREPDFLLMIIDKQQNHSSGSQFYHSSLNWLIDLVESYESNYGLLPVQCLCEFLLKQIAEETHVQSTNMADISKLEKAKKKEKRRKLIRLIAYFQDDIIQTANSEKLSNAFEYLIRHLSHPRSTTRMFAYKALYVIVSIDVGKYLQMLDDNMMPSLFANESIDWFRTNLIKFLKSDLQIQAMCAALNAALSVESNTSLICEYLEFIAEYIRNPDEILLQKCSSLLIQRRKIAMHIVKYSDHKFKQRFLHSLFKIYWLYLQSLMANTKCSSIRPMMEGKKYVYLKLPNIGQRIMIDSEIIYSIILSLSFVDDDFEFSDYYDNLAQHFLDEPYPQIFADVEMKHLESPIPEWLLTRLLSTESSKIVTLLLETVKIENIIPKLDSYGLSTIVLQSVLQALDKLTAAESRTIKNLNFDRPNLLAAFHVFWSKNITVGYKFAKSHLNYKAGSEEIDDVEMNELPKKRDDRSQESSRSETFRKDDIIKMFEEKNFVRLTFLTRIIVSELNDPSMKTKKLTKQFLVEFSDAIEDLTDEIMRGTFNSIFNVIIISAVKDSKHFGLNSELTNIKKQLLSLELENIESTMLWKCFDRFLHKD
ncbi:integrator complex subunit 1-like protein, partial [Euroglyphus maynei]